MLTANMITTILQQVMKAVGCCGSVRAPGIWATRERLQVLSPTDKTTNKQGATPLQINLLIKSIRYAVYVRLKGNILEISGELHVGVSYRNYTCCELLLSVIL